MKKFSSWFALAAVLWFSSSAVNAQPKLVQTIDLRAWAGVPVPIAQIAPQPPPAFSLTGIVFNPLSNTIYVSDYGTDQRLRHRWRD